ncbi:MAG: tRNA threonylcarbamoyladenosine dehydratase [Clostridium butyricum]|nr:tRNA threonylcarbamoyladenosine dehydratase [Clostridium butyricum]
MEVQDTLIRTGFLIGADGIEKLKNSRVIVFGVGGVGSFTVEALARVGVGEITLIDNDTVDISNLNRQIHATYETVGKPKVDIMKERILSINKECNVIIHRVFVNNDNIEELVPKDVDYVVDAIDTVTAKLGLAEYCYKNNIKIMSCMGTGNKLDPTQFKVTDVFKTKVCPLAKVMRRELKKRGVDKLKVVYSEEVPLKPLSPIELGFEQKETEQDSEHGRLKVNKQSPGSISFVPPVAGMIIAGEVVRDILGI